MSRDASRRPPKPKKRAVGGSIPDQGKGYVPALHYSLFTQAIGFGAPKRPCEKSKENHWGGHVRFPRSLASQLFSVGDICTISEPDTFYRGLKCILREYLAFDRVWKVKLDMRTNVVKVEERYLTLEKATHEQAPDHAKDCAVSTQRVVNVKSTKDEPWGMSIPSCVREDRFNEGINILEVLRGRQFENLHIQVDWVVVAVQVAGVNFTDKLAMRKFLQDGVECDITFDTSLAKSVATPKEESVQPVVRTSHDFKLLFECKRCGCTGHCVNGYLWDDDHEKKCFCDSCCDSGCYVVKLTKCKRREKKAKAIQRATRKPRSKPKPEAGLKLKRGECSTCGCTGFTHQGRICDFEGVKVCHCRKCDKNGCIIKTT